MVNKSYLKKETLSQIKEYFRANGFVTLQEFFTKEEFGKIKKKISSLKFRKEDEPLTHRYSSAKISLGLGFASKICGKKLKSAAAIKLKHRNYELRGSPKAGFEVIFCVNSFNESY